MASEIVCNFSRAIYPANSVVSASIAFTPNKRDTKHSTGITHAIFQACGHVIVDNRWAKTKTLSDYYDDSILEIAHRNAFDHHPSYHVKKSYSNMFSSTVFQSTSKAISFNEFVAGNGVIMQFQLPRDVLCSYKGLSLTVQYNIVVRLVNFEGESHHAVFPFQVLSGGSIKYPYQPRLSETVLFPVQELANKINPLFALSERDVVDHDYAFQEIYTQKAKNYLLINNSSTLCSLEILSLFDKNDSLVTFAGNNIHIRFNFAGSNMTCTSLKVSLLQAEERNDKSRLQEQVVSSMSRCCIDALLLQSKIYIPNILPCTFDAPTAKVSFSLKIELLTDMQVLASKNIVQTPKTALASPAPESQESILISRHSQGDIKESTDPDDPFVLILPVYSIIPPNVVMESWNMMEEALGSLEPAVTLTQAIQF